MHALLGYTITSLHKYFIETTLSVWLRKWQSSVLSYSSHVLM